MLGDNDASEVLIDQDLTEVAAIDPVASMQAIDNPNLKQPAERVGILLKKVIDGLEA